MDEKSLREWAATQPEQEPFYAYIAVESADLRLAELADAIGHAPSPDLSRDIGDTSPLRSAPFEISCWAMKLALDPSVHPGTDGLSDAIELLSADFADRLAGLAAKSCDVEVAVVQTLTDDAWTAGLHLCCRALVGSSGTGRDRR